MGNNWKCWLIRYAKSVLSSLLGWCVTLAEGDRWHKERIRASQAGELEGGYTGQCWKMVGLRSVLLGGMIEGQKLFLIMQHTDLTYRWSTVARWFAFVIGWILSTSSWRHLVKYLWNLYVNDLVRIQEVSESWLLYSKNYFTELPVKKKITAVYIYMGVWGKVGLSQFHWYILLQLIIGDFHCN